jgi:hypothetical protein
METNKAPVLAVDPERVYVNCPFCDKVHVHYSDEGIDKSTYGMRGSDCRDKKPREYELVCDGSTVRSPKKLDKNWIEKTYGMIVPGESKSGL